MMHAESSYRDIPISQLPAGVAVAPPPSGLGLLLEHTRTQPEHERVQ
jgi:hypothetical protein